MKNAETYAYPDPDNTFYDLFQRFTDREHILHIFRQLLHTAQPHQFRLLAVKGNSGTGKTFLINYLIQRVCPEVGWQSGQISYSDSRPDFRSLLEELGDALESCVSAESFEKYKEQCNKYNCRFNEYQTHIHITQIAEASNQSYMSHPYQNLQVNLQQRERELQLRHDLTEALKGLGKYIERPLCLFIDGYEYLTESDPEFVSWLWEKVLLRLAKTAPQPLLVVTCGWEWPSNAAVKPFTYTEDLTDFDRAQVKRYLEKQGMVTSTDVSTSQTEELIDAFHELTKGHPLVLGLASTYFNTLDSLERTPQNLRADRPLIDEQARVNFLEERILSRLSEPYRTMLERGPILRSIHQTALQELLSIKIKGTEETINKLDDRIYSHFLQYPFINITSGSNRDSHMIQYGFHALVRHVRLEALRRHHPETKKFLHIAMVSYYAKIITAGQNAEMLHLDPDSHEVYIEQETLKNYSIELQLPEELSEKQLEALLEYFYHALQVEELQTEAFELWKILVNRQQPHYSWSLLRIVQQLIEEGERFFKKTQRPYGLYLLYYSYLLMQEAYWEDARTLLEDAVQIFEKIGDLTNLSVALNNLSVVFDDLGRLEQALDCLERSHALGQQEGDTHSLARYHANVGGIYLARGQSDQALSNFEKALVFYKKQDMQKSVPHMAATVLNNIGIVYRDQKKWEQALRYFEQALTLREQIGNQFDIAISLNNVGSIHYYWQRNVKQALTYFERALAISEKMNGRAQIIMSLNHIGYMCKVQGKVEEALSFFERALLLNEQVGNPSETAITLSHLSGIHLVQGKVEQALNEHQRALALFEQGGNPHKIYQHLDEIGHLYKNQKEWEQALSFFERALLLKEQVGDQNGIAISVSQIGDIYQEQGKVEQALNAYQRALTLFEQGGNSRKIYQLLNDIGCLYQTQYKWEQALNYFKRALTFIEHENDDTELAQLLQIIAMIYQIQGKQNSALIYFERTLLYEKQEKNRADIALCIDNIGQRYLSHGQLEQALNCHKRALALFEQASALTETVSCLNNIGKVYQAQGKLKQALSYYQQALKINEQIDDPVTLVSLLNNVGSIYIMQGELRQALTYIEQALTVCKQEKRATTYIAACYHNMGAVYSKQKAWKQAIEYATKALKINEALGDDFEARVADELEALAYCYNQVGPRRKALAYTERAQQIREHIKKTSG